MIEPGKFKPLDRYVAHTISVEVGRVSGETPAVEARQRVEAALALGRGTIYVLDPQGQEAIASTQLLLPGQRALLR